MYDISSFDYDNYSHSEILEILLAMEEQDEELAAMTEHLNSV